MKNQNKSNLKTALVLLSVVLIFFIGVIAKQTLLR
ncbi:cytochrome oxidase small assembly protein [Undibacterium seohonense]|nr:cytochrome oxidase small assembly protein [Undibacterium seohonense]